MFYGIVLVAVRRCLFHTNIFFIIVREHARARSLARSLVRSFVRSFVRLRLFVCHLWSILILIILADFWYRRYTRTQCTEADCFCQGMQVKELSDFTGHRFSKKTFLSLFGIRLFSASPNNFWGEIGLTNQNQHKQIDRILSIFFQKRFQIFWCF